MEIKELTSDEEIALEKNLIWLFGFSSKTIKILSDILSFQTHVYYEPKIGLQINTIKRAKNNPESSSYFEVRQKTLKKDKPKYDYFFFKGYQETWKFYLRKLILARIHAQFPDLKKEILICEPDGIPASEIISEIFPNSKIIFLVQDGRELVANHAGNIIQSLHSNEKNEKLDSNSTVKKIVEEQSKQWNGFVHMLMKTMKIHDDKLLLLLQAEDLKKNPHDFFNKVYKFLGFSIMEKQLEEFIDKQKIDRNGQGIDSKTHLMNEYQKLMEGIMREKLQLLGYAKK